jgi:hypothetical protein
MSFIVSFQNQRGGLPLQNILSLGRSSMAFMLIYDYFSFMAFELIYFDKLVFEDLVFFLYVENIPNFD